MDRLSSKDWMSDYQQSHVDVDLISVFGTTSSTCSNTTGASAGNAGCSSSRQPDNHPFIKQEEGTRSPLSPSATTARPVKPKTDWTGEYYSILVGQSPAAISQLPPSILKPPSQHAATRTSFRSRSLSWGSSVETKPSRPDGQEAMDVFKPSVDFSSLLTPSIDAALNSMHQIDSDKSVLQCSEDVLAAITPESPPPPTDDTATVPSEPICMDIEDEEPAEEEEEPASTLDTDVAMILALSRKEKEELLKKKQVPSQKKRTNVRRVREPQVKEFVEPKETDVLFGRGGRSNHHTGNVAYRNEVGKLRDWYRSSEKNAKTDLSQLLVDWVHEEQQGRFLKLDVSSDRWYVVTNVVARRKASQALREHMTPEEREAKKGAKS